MARWQLTEAQQAVNIVAATMAGRPRHEVTVELDHWLARRRAVLPRPLLARTVDAIAGGSGVVVLPVPDDSPVPGDLPVPGAAPAAGTGRRSGEPTGGAPASSVVAGAVPARA